VAPLADDFCVIEWYTGSDLTTILATLDKFAYTYTSNCTTRCLNSMY